MKIVHTVSEIEKELSTAKKEGLQIGFVPTMGALHEGHLSLIKKSIEDNDFTVVSIFVNPTQFNDKNDFDKYPRNVEQDAKLLERTGVDIVFAPTEREIYPEPDTRQFDFGKLDKVMEGKFRPGHFNGVAQVVSRLFGIVEPDKAYFGEKDFQQLAIIRNMTKQLNLPVQIIGMPILREASGLAMSSRNERLTAEQRNIASKIYESLKESAVSFQKRTVQETADQIVANINKERYLKVEYMEIVDGNTLQPINDWKETDYAVGCIAVFCGDVRLIDNITYFCR
ncbi:MAG: pantoate--beta-alanine ligase [Dysgonomonas sp.]